MNIHLPAILMFTRGTRFWHTAKWWNWWSILFKDHSIGFWDITSRWTFTKSCVDRRFGLFHLTIVCILFILYDTYIYIYNIYIYNNIYIYTIYIYIYRLYTIIHTYFILYWYIYIYYSYIWYLYICTENAEVLTASGWSWVLIVFDQSLMTLTSWI